MAFQQVPETVEITTVWDYVTQEVTNTYYARQSGGYNQAGIDALALAVDTNAIGGFKALMSNRDAYIRTDVRGLDVINDITSTSNVLAGAGALATFQMPSFTTWIVSQRSGFSGRAANGYVAVCGINSDDVDFDDDQSNEIELANANAWTAVVDGVRIAIDNVGTWNPVLVSRYLNGSKRATGITFEWTSSAWNSLKLSHRRSRRA